MPRDFYEILGVSRTADAATIKKAYRRLAKQFHPDVNKAADAREKFGEVQEAFDVLKDDAKRKRYDRFGHAGVDPSAAAGGGGPGGFGDHRTYTGPGGGSYRVDFGQGDEAVDLDGIFEQFFGGRGKAGPSGGGGGGFGGFGGRRGGRRTAKPKASRGADLQHTVSVSFDHAARGGPLSLRMEQGAGGPKQTLEVRIPPATADGAKLRIRAKGHPAPGRRGEPGDLILTVKVAAHPLLRRDGLDLLIDVPLSIDEAIFGTKVEVPTIGGRATLTVPPGSGGGRKLRLRGAGIEDAKGTKGDLYALLRVDVPGELTDEQREMFEPLRGKLPDPRKAAGW